LLPHLIFVKIYHHQIQQLREELFAELSVEFSSTIDTFVMKSRDLMMIYFDEDQVRKQGEKKSHWHLMLGKWRKEEIKIYHHQIQQLREELFAELSVEFSSTIDTFVMK
jgi:GTP cyclohydrolase III